MAGSAKMLFSNDFDDLHDDGFVGSADEYRIFAKVFFGNDSGSGKGCVVGSGKGCVVTGCYYNKQTDISLCSNSGNSSLTSQDDCFDAKEDSRGKTPLECLSKDLTSSNKINHEAKLAVENHPNGKPDLGNILNISVCEGIVMGMSQQDSYPTCHTLTHCLLESSGEGVIYRHYQSKGHVDLGQGYEISGMGGSNTMRYPYGHEELAVCEDIDQVRSAMEKYPPYQSIFSKLSYGESRMLDKAFYEEEVKRLCLAFEQQVCFSELPVN